MAVATNPLAGGVVALGLELRDVFAGFVQSAEGGDAVGHVDEPFPDDQGRVDKQLDRVSFTEIVLACDTELDPRLSDWIASLLQRQSVIRSGAILTLDYRGTESSRRERPRSPNSTSRPSTRPRATRPD